MNRLESFAEDIIEEERNDDCRKYKITYLKTRELNLLDILYGLLGCVVICEGSKLYNQLARRMISASLLLEKAGSAYSSAGFKMPKFNERAVFEYRQRYVTDV